MAPSGVNDTMRENMAALAKWYKDTNGSLVTAGTSTAYTLTTNGSGHAALADQSLIVCEIDEANGASPTLNVDSLGAKDIVLPDGSNIPSGALKAGTIAVFGYESDADVYVLIGGASGSASVLDTGTASGDVPVLGASGTLDSAIYGSAVPVGTVLPYVGSSAPSRFYILNGDSIGSAASGADQASDDNEALFTLFWNSMANTEAAVSGGRGASAAADWSANKTLTMPDARGRTIIGTGTGASLTARTHGDTDGEEEHELTIDEMPSHSHGQGTQTLLNNSSAGANANLSVGGGQRNQDPFVPQGGNSAHNNMQPWLALNWIVRF